MTRRPAVARIGTVLGELSSLLRPSRRSQQVLLPRSLVQLTARLWSWRQFVQSAQGFARQSLGLNSALESEKAERLQLSAPPSLSTTTECRPVSGSAMRSQQTLPTVMVTEKPIEKEMTAAPKMKKQTRMKMMMTKKKKTTAAAAKRMLQSLKE